MHATVVEFDALANAVGTAAQHHNFLLVGDHTFVGFFLKSAVVVRGQGREFCRTRVHQLVNPGDAFLVTTAVHFAFEAVQDVCNLPVGVPLALGFPQGLRGQFPNGVLRQFLFKHHELLNLTKEPRINFGGFENAPEWDAQLEGVVYMEQPVPRRVLEAVHDRILVAELSAVRTQAIALQFQRLTCLLEGLLEGSAYGHHLSHGLHLQPQLTVASWELVEIPTRDFHDHIIERGLENIAEVFPVI